LKRHIKLNQKQNQKLKPLKKLLTWLELLMMLSVVIAMRLHQRRKKHHLPDNRSTLRMRQLKSFKKTVLKKMKISRKKKRTIVERTVVKEMTEEIEEIEEKEEAEFIEIEEALKKVVMIEAITEEIIEAIEAITEDQDLIPPTRRLQRTMKDSMLSKIRLNREVEEDQEVEETTEVEKEEIEVVTSKKEVEATIEEIEEIEEVRDPEEEIEEIEEIEAEVVEAEEKDPQESRLTQMKRVPKPVKPTQLLRCD